MLFSELLRSRSDCGAIFLRQFRPYMSSLMFRFMFANPNHGLQFLKAIAKARLLAGNRESYSL